MGEDNSDFVNILSYWLCLIRLILVFTDIPDNISADLSGDLPGEVLLIGDYALCVGGGTCVIVVGVLDIFLLEYISTLILLSSLSNVGINFVLANGNHWSILASCKIISSIDILTLDTRLLMSS